MIDAQDKAGRCTLRLHSSFDRTMHFLSDVVAYANALIQAQHSFYEAFPLLLLFVRPFG